MHTIFRESARPRWIASAALAVALTIPGAANAGSTAYSTIQISNGVFFDASDGNVGSILGGTPATAFQVTRSSGGLAPVAGEISIGSFGSQFSLTATRPVGPGAPLNESNSANDISIVNGINYGVVGQTAGDIIVSDPCGGAAGQCSGIGQDNFAQQPIGTGEFSRAVGEKFGTGILNTGPAPAGGLLHDSAAAEIISQVESVSSANTTATSTVGFSLSVATDMKLGFAAELLRFAEAILDTEITSGNSSASSQFQFNIKESNAAPGVFLDLQLLGGPTVNQILLGASATATNPGDATTDGAPASSPIAFRTANDLLAGVSYEVFFSVTTQANLNQIVPEPAPLALLGLGLLAAAGLRRRRQLAA